MTDSFTAEMKKWFSETSTKLLRYIACLNSKKSLSKFDHDMLSRLAQISFYDFSVSDHLILKERLCIYINDVRRNYEFSSCHNLANLAVEMVQTDKHLIFHWFITLLN